MCYKVSREESPERKDGLSGHPNRTHLPSDLAPGFSAATGSVRPAARERRRLSDVRRAEVAAPRP